MRSLPRLHAHISVPAGPHRPRLPLPRAPIIVGGVSYVMGGLLAAVPAAVALGLPDLASLPATVGELWIMFALVGVGVRGGRTGAAHAGRSGGRPGPGDVIGSGP